MNFSILPVGDYVLEIHKADSGRSSGPEASAKQYPLIFWPDNDPDNISWLHLTGGGETDVGSIDYAKADPIRIRGVIAAGCPPANGGIGSLDRKIGGAFVPQQQSYFVCGDGSFPIPVRAAGIYRVFRLSVGKRASTVTAEFKAVEGDNPDVDVKPTELSGIRGKVTCECQAPFIAGPERAGLSLNPVFLNAGLSGSFDFNADGAFEGQMAMSGPVLVQFLNLPQDLYVKRIALNGKETGPVVNILRGSSVSIEVTLSDTPATLSGTVVRQDKPAAHAHVVAVPWPTRMEGGYPDFVTSEAGDNGEFTVGNLPPGTYKVVSVAPEEWSHKDEPNVVESWLASGNEITLAEKESRTVRLESKLQ